MRENSPAKENSLGRSRRISSGEPLNYTRVRARHSVRAVLQPRPVSAPSRHAELVSVPIVANRDDSAGRAAAGLGLFVQRDETEQLQLSCAKACPAISLRPANRSARCGGIQPQRLSLGKTTTSRASASYHPAGSQGTSGRNGGRAPAHWPTLDGTGPRQ